MQDFPPACRFARRPEEPANAEEYQLRPACDPETGYQPSRYLIPPATKETRTGIIRHGQNT
jgi:hypothetical protein